MSESLSRYQNTKPVKPPNEVVEIIPNGDGTMTCKQRSGDVFTIQPEDPTFKTFVS